MGNSHSISAQSAFDCAQKGDTRSLQTLLQEVQQRRGTSDMRSYVEYRDPRGLTPLMAAAANGYVDSVRLVTCQQPVLRVTLDPDSQPSVNPPLHLRFGVDVQLLRYGASVHAASSPPESTTALHLAANGHLAAVDVLIDAGANPFIENGRRALQLYRRCM
jgi:hypothetical protein